MRSCWMGPKRCFGGPIALASPRLRKPLPRLGSPQRDEGVRRKARLARVDFGFSRRHLGALRLRNGVDIECRPASFRSIRGASACGFILDELAYWHVEGTKNPDSEILAAARPALATLGGPIIAVSSPYAKRGELWSAFKRDYGPDGDPGIAVINAPSERMNPCIDMAVVKRAYSRDPQSAASEYGAQFRSDVAGFLDFEVVDGAVDRGVLVRPPRAGVDYRSGCDMSGGSHDSSVLSVCHDEASPSGDKGSTAVLDCLVEISAPHNPTSAVGLRLLPGLRPVAAVVDPEEVGAAQDDQRHPGRDDQPRSACQRTSGEVESPHTYSAGQHQQPKLRRLTDCASRLAQCSSLFIATASRHSTGQPVERSSGVDGSCSGRPFPALRLC